LYLICLWVIFLSDFTFLSFIVHLSVPFAYYDSFLSSLGWCLVSSISPVKYRTRNIPTRYLLRFPRSSRESMVTDGRLCYRFLFGDLPRPAERGWAELSVPGWRARRCRRMTVRTCSLPRVGLCATSFWGGGGAPSSSSQPPKSPARPTPVCVRPPLGFLAAGKPHTSRSSCLPVRLLPAVTAVRETRRRQQSAALHRRENAPPPVCLPGAEIAFRALRRPRIGHAHPPLRPNTPSPRTDARKIHAGLIRCGAGPTGVLKCSP